MRQPTPTPEVSPEIRNELTIVMQELLLKAHELAFEYSTMDCEKIQECPLARKSKELFKVVKQMRELVEQISKRQTTQAVT